MPLNGFNILRELDSNYSKTVNTNGTFRTQADIGIIGELHLSDSYLIHLQTIRRTNRRQVHVFSLPRQAGKRQQVTDEPLRKYLAEQHEQEQLRGQRTFLFQQDFSDIHTLNLLAGAELRGSGANTLYTKRYNYDPKTGTDALPPISGPQEEWLSEVEN